MIEKDPVLLCHGCILGPNFALIPTVYPISVRTEERSVLESIQSTGQQSLANTDS